MSSATQLHATTAGEPQVLKTTTVGEPRQVYRSSVTTTTSSTTGEPQVYRTSGSTGGTSHVFKTTGEPRQVYSQVYRTTAETGEPQVCRTTTTVGEPQVYKSSSVTVYEIKDGVKKIKYSSTDSGWDNPFRPDGDLSREADQIVELIKGGKPITPTPGSAAPKLPSVSDDAADGRVSAEPAPPAVAATPQPQRSLQPQKAGGANGAAPCTEEKQQSAAAPVEVKRETVVPPSDASQVEHVVLKKKPKCKCCVIQ